MRIGNAALESREGGIGAVRGVRGEHAAYVCTLTSHKEDQKGSKHSTRSSTCWAGDFRAEYLAGLFAFDHRCQREWVERG